jgi:hypothetical protein
VAATRIASLPKAEAILEHDGAMTSVVVIDAGSTVKPTIFQVLALHDEADRPNAWEFGSPARTITLPTGTYTAFVTHVVLWRGHVAGHDMWSNAPGLGRLALFIARRTDERVLFRPLFDPSLRDRLDDLRGWRGIDIAIHDPEKREAAKRLGLFGGLLSTRVPTIHVTMGMGRSGPRDAYLDPDVADQVLAEINNAEDLFDGLVIRGHSKSMTTPAGRPKLIEINLLTERLHEVVDLPADGDATNLPDPGKTVRALTNLRRKMHNDGRLGKALEARIGPGAD